jgi:hypothetical protein
LHPSAFHLLHRHTSPVQLPIPNNNKLPFLGWRARCPSTLSVPLAANERTTADAWAVTASSTPTSLAGTYISLLCIRTEPVTVALRSCPSWLGSP